MSFAGEQELLEGLLAARPMLENGEALTATASRIDHWLIVEYRGLWGRTPYARRGSRTR